MKRLDRLMYWINERHSIYVKRFVEKLPPPWTDDSILHHFRFTNVFRELDKTTVWFRLELRDPLRTSTAVLWATLVFRWFNRIETGRVLAPYLLAKTWQPTRAEAAVRKAIPKGPWTTGSYIISSPPGYDKLAGVFHYLEAAREQLPDLLNFFTLGATLEQATERLAQLHGMSAFMSYEVVTDLRWTWLLRMARDKNTWANPGPGARRGVSRLLHGNVQSLPSHEALEVMRELLPQVNAARAPHVPKLEMRDLEHSLCEFDKYERARHGEGRPRGVFPHGR
jgi:hypothetical protein